jgi:hypothetical protein
MLLHLHNFDIIRILVPQLTQGKHHTGEDSLNGIFILIGSGEGQGDSGLFFVHLGFAGNTQYLFNGTGCKLHGSGDSSTDNVCTGLSIAAVARDAEPGDSVIAIEKLYSSHYTEIFSICTLV